MALQYSGPLQADFGSGYGPLGGGGALQNVMYDDNKDDFKSMNNNANDTLTKLPNNIFGNKGTQYMCEVCGSVPLKVVSCNKAHIFCKDCITDLQKNNKPCPADNTKIIKISENNQALDKIIRKQTVCCLYSSLVSNDPNEGNGLQEGVGKVTKGADIAPPAAYGVINDNKNDDNDDDDDDDKDDDDTCSWKGTVGELLDHLKICQFKPVVCPFKSIGCKTDDNKQNNKLNKHYNDNNQQHSNLILSEIFQMNSKINKMQMEINNLKTMIVSQQQQQQNNAPGSNANNANNNTVEQQLNELRSLITQIQISGGGGSGMLNDAQPGKPVAPAGPDPSKNVLIAVGCNEKGDLGKGDDDNIQSLEMLAWSRNLSLIKLISCSYKAFCYITSSNQLYISGCNDFGQLGINNEEDQWDVKEHEFFISNKLLISSISRSVNAFHIFFICTNGSIYCSGANEYGQLGLDDVENYIIPQANEYFNNKNDVNIVSISCGEYHTLFLTDDGQVYSCGLNESFQLGYKTSAEQQTKPKKIVNFKDIKIIQIACGRDHSYCLSDSGDVYSFGSNYRGQLGVNKNVSSASSSKYSIHKISWFPSHNKSITSISSGNYHGAAIDKSGNVFVWGRGDEGQIGNGKKSDKFLPTNVDLFNNMRIIEISCGCHHTIALTEDYKLYCWGNNRYNQCADVYIDKFSGDHKSVRKPKEYYSIDNKDDKLQSIEAGSYHTLLLLNKPF